MKYSDIRDDDYSTEGNAEDTGGEDAGTCIKDKLQVVPSGI